MGMHRRFTFLLLLLSLHASGSFVRATALLDLPRVVTLSEDAMPGTRVAKVTVSCRNASGSPNVTLYGIEPGHPFNPIAISADPMDATAFQAEVTLRAGAELDAHRVNQYLLTLWATCPGEEEVQERLFVRVTRGQVLRCDKPFASAEGDVVQVPADVAPQTPLYAVLPQPLAGLMFRLRTHETPLTLTRRGLVLAPANGFNPSQDIQTFRLEIEVMDRHGHNCSGVVRVEVLPSHRPRVTFREPQWSVTVTKNISPLEVVTQVRASGDNVRYAILAPAVPVLFTINEVTGEILSTHQLQVAHAQLLVQAYNALHPNDHDTATVNITVQGTDQQAPSCVPAIFVSQQPETVSPGSTLVTLRCTDFSGTERQLQYDLEGPPASRSSFHMEGPRLKVNTTLDYDSEDMAAVGFQLTATIVVTAGGQPPQSTRVPVFLTLTPVNEFTPVCPSGATFTVLEMAAFGTTVGRVTGTDRDYPQNSLEYSLEGGPGPAQPFSIDTQTGEIRVVGSLDSQRHRSYRLSVRLTDTQNDVDPAKRRSCLCDVTVHLQAVPDQVPVCTPEVQELWVVAGPGSRQPVTHLVCQGDTALTYAIAGGNKDGRFRLEGNTIFYLPNGLSEPCTYVLLVKVWSSSGAPHHSTVVTLAVHVTPWSTPVPPSTTTQHMMLQKEPLVITRTVAVWHPPPWFVAVLTVSSALLLVTLGCMAWRLPCRNRSPGKLLLDKSSWDAEEQRGDKEKQGHPHASSPGQFDGRAQDPRTGRDYLFNSKTGARRWI
ncbi:cadherin-related family member 4 [Dryobates pubescens]|uniref:cadherin-related family member 4 n=1 Tax=Dryobates pubescens TaxID=118200 RepID=UPI0023B9E62F|nr:cadherin-related family member 4 [Dryobates pubescens]